MERLFGDEEAMEIFLTSSFYINVTWMSRKFPLPVPARFRLSYVLTCDMSSFNFVVIAQCHFVMIATR